MDRKKLIEPLIYIILIVALLAPRLPALDSYVTLDEPYWLSMGANFYYALGQREFQNTVYEYQPAVTTMWIVTAAMLVYFPEYRGFGQGYLDYNKGWLDGFLREYGKDPLELLAVSRTIQVFIIAILFLILYYLLQRFIPKWIAAFVIIFASFDPFFMGHSRMLDHEAMLSLFVMISLFALSIYLTQGRHIGFLLLSGISAGIAQITKSSAVAILMPAGILFLTQAYRQRADGLWQAVLKNAKTLGIWLLLLIGAYILFWPGMWVAPQKMLYEVYGNAFSYAFQGARLTVTGELETARFSLENRGAGVFLALIEVIIRRTTPLTWLGVLFAFAIPFSRQPHWENIRKHVLALLWITPVAFLLMFGIARGRNSPHYLLCCYLALNLLAGLGWVYIFEQISKSFNARALQFQYAGFILLAALQLSSALSYFPYYYTYENPILANYNRDAKFPLFPYGEGLEFAGQYLASLPDAKNSSALVYYSRGSFSYFYPGRTDGFKPYYIDGVHAEDLLRSIKSVNYLVFYYPMQGQGKYIPYAKAMSAAQPLHEIWLDGRKYVVIYQVDQIPESVFKALANLPIQNEQK